MSIPANIVSELQFLQNQLASSSPLSQASRPAITALQLNADQLVTDTEEAQYTLAGSLDTWTPGVDPVTIIKGILDLYQNSVDESNIVQMRGFVGRAASNLNQLP